MLYDDVTGVLMQCISRIPLSYRRKAKTPRLRGFWWCLYVPFPALISGTRRICGGSSLRRNLYLTNRLFPEQPGDRYINSDSLKWSQILFMLSYFLDSPSTKKLEIACSRWNPVRISICTTTNRAINNGWAAFRVNIWFSSVLEVRLSHPLHLVFPD